MSYRIVYGPEIKPVQNQGASTTRLRTLTAALLLSFALTVKLLWPEGTEMLREILIPTDLTVTEQAFQSMMEDLSMGEDLGEAITVFCRQIIENE